MADRAPGRRSRGDWLSELPFRTIVLHRTVGLYRNLAETVFPERATPAGLAGARTRVLEALSSAASATRRRVSRVEGGWEAACGGVPPAEAPFFAGLPVPADPKAARSRSSTVRARRSRASGARSRRSPPPSAPRRRSPSRRSTASSPPIRTTSATGSS